MRISARLRAILTMVQGRVLADIGTDHAFVPIAACLDGIVERAIACDRCPGPLEKARVNIVHYGLESRIETRLGFGLEPLTEYEVECVIIAGMGGMNIIEILKTPRPIKRLILQPQRDIPLVRDFLHDMGYKTFNELTVSDRGRSYTVIGADRSGDKSDYSVDY